MKNNCIHASYYERLFADQAVQHADCWTCLQSMFFIFILPPGTPAELLIHHPAAQTATFFRSGKNAMRSTRWRLSYSQRYGFGGQLRAVLCRKWSWESFGGDNHVGLCRLPYRCSDGRQRTKFLRQKLETSPGYGGDKAFAPAHQQLIIDKYSHETAASAHWSCCSVR